MGRGIRVRDLCVRAPVRFRAGMQRRRRVHGQLQLAAGGARPGGVGTAPQDVQVGEVMSSLWVLTSSSSTDQFWLLQDWIGLS